MMKVPIGWIHLPGKHNESLKCIKFVACASVPNVFQIHLKNDTVHRKNEDKKRVLSSHRESAWTPLLATLRQRTALRPLDATTRRALGTED